MVSSQIDESSLRHPADRLVFIVSVVMNLALMAAAVYLVANGPDWLSSHPMLSKSAQHLRMLAIAAIFALPVTTVVRNVRRGQVRENSIRLSPSQFGSIYGMFQAQCKKLGLATLPELYVTNSAITSTATSFSSFRRDYVVLGQSIVDSDLAVMGEALAFVIGRELGRIRLGYTRLWTEVLLTYVLRVPYLDIPISRVRTYSCDRYGAFLAPEGVRGLVMLASGRRLLQKVNVEDYLRQAGRLVGFWEQLASIVTARPPVLCRVKALYDAGLMNWEKDLRRFQEGSGSNETAGVEKSSAPRAGSDQAEPPSVGKEAARQS